jgi:hypothetical protein
MKKVVVDAVLRKKLLTITEPVELCDESGKVLGHFLPTIDLSVDEIDLSEFALDRPLASDEELERRSQSNEKIYTTAEVLAYHEKLGQ